MTVLEAALITVIAAATPLLLAAMGELVVERSGVLNLGVEGMMLMGAIVGFAAGIHPAALPSPVVMLAAAGAGALMASLFALLVLVFRTNQVATGLALAIFGIGLSKLVGASYTGLPANPFPTISIPGLSSLPIIGTPLFATDAFTYLSWLMIPAVAWFLYRSKAGLILRAVGENHDSAHAIGHKVLWVRLGAILFGGAMSGLGGAYLSLVKTPHWAENMTAGRGWVALALIVFATWRPGRLALGAYLFGLLSIMELYAQASAVPIPTNFLTMMPFLATILVLVIMSRDPSILRRHAPGSLGKLFNPSR